MIVVTIETPELGDRSYLVSDGSVALVVDPQRDIDRVLAIAAQLDVTITHVLETHVHNDYVSGGLHLSRTCGATYVLAEAEPVSFASERLGVADGTVILSGALRVRALHTPGHTPQHMSYAVEGPGGRTAVFTGGSMLHGTAGRTDLSGEDRVTALARDQWRSLRRLARELPDGASVMPTHGFGSYCAAGRPDGRRSSTIAEERDLNRALQLDEEAFAVELVAGFGPYPCYYAHMGAINRAGPAPFDPEPVAEAGAEELARRLAGGEWVVDLRPRRVYATRHLKGTINVEASPTLATQVGWILPWGTRLSLLGDEPQVAAAQRALARIGLDHIEVRGSPPGGEGVDETRLSSYPVATFADLTRATQSREPLVVVDVRYEQEWRSGHLPGALHVPLYELSDRVDELPRGVPLWVHCAAGFRSSVAASILERSGRQVVLVDDQWIQPPPTGDPGGLSEPATQLLRAARTR